MAHVLWADDHQFESKMPSTQNEMMSYSIHGVDSGSSFKTTIMIVHDCGLTQLASLDKAIGTGL